MPTPQSNLKLALIALTAIILAACSSGGSDEDPVTNTAPTFSASSVSISVEENVIGVIYTAQATDAEGNTINYALSGGVDQAKFSIDASSGELRFVSAPDYEVPDDDGRDRTYEVQISASDSLASSSMSLSVSITNVVEDGESNNRAPTASISVSPDPDSTTLTTATEITLNGSDSSDPDGDTLDYTWSQASNQSIDLSSTSTATTTFTAANPGTYTFTLTVDDGSLTDSAEVTLEIIQADSTNRAPTAIISVSPDPDSTTLTTTTEITLDGSNSSDLDEDTLTYEWSQPSSQSIDLSATNATTTFTATAPGTYTFTLTVDDGELEHSSQVTLEISQANRAPIASISVSPDPDSTTLTTATEITLDGSASSDPDEDTLTYEWSQPSSQSIELSSTTTATTTFTATAPGTYTFTLTVDDGELDHSSEVTLEISQANRAPIASISVSPDPDSTTLTTATEITLDGSGSSDPDSNTLDYTWSQPDDQSIQLSSTNTATTTFTANEAGTYTFTLTVDDGELDHSSEVTLEISQANRTPTAIISVSPDPDNTTLTTDTEITLDGSGSSDPDSNTLDYTWSQPDDQSIQLSSTTTATTTFTATAPGTYTFTLTVDDGELDHSSEVTLEISQANRAPIASISVSPDPDSTTLTTATEITLNGSDSSDPDGDTLTYEWSQPSNQSIDLSSTSTASTTFTAAEGGTYTFTLTVSDNELYNSVESVITIHPITLPTDFTATAGDAQVTLTWTPYSDSTSHTIYRSTDQDCDPTIANISTNCSSGAAFANVSSGFVDTGLTNGITYYYWIEATLNNITQQANDYISAITAYPTPIAVTGILNDTGINWGGDYPSNNNSDCSSDVSAPQDCHQGRDATHNDDSDGHAGFSFTKLDSDGKALPTSATSWSCVQDNVTGLIWEVKTSDGLHGRDDSYNWYNTNPNTNGGKTGYKNDDGDICYGYDSSDDTTYCNTEAFAARVNEFGLCGYHDWRLPNIEELISIVDQSRVNPSIDTDYFPNTSSETYWSASPYAGTSATAWLLGFYHGYEYGDYFSSGSNDFVRLVRSE